MRAFEIQTYQSGKWKIDSVFDDKELAVFEARRMDESGRHSGIRVIEEEYDEQTKETRVRTIFRGSKVQQANSAAMERNKTVRRQVAQQRQKRTQDDVVRRRVKVQAEKERKSNPVRLAMIMTGLMIVALGALIMLREAESLF